MNFTSVESSVNLSLQSIKNTVDRIIQKDDMEAAEGSTHIDGCARGDVDRFLQDGRDLTERLRVDQDKPKAVWREFFQSSAARPGHLHAIDADWSLLDRKLVDLHAKVADMKMQTHWQGQGAEAYLKELPYQEAALQELLKMTRFNRSGLDRIAQIMQGTLLAIETHFKSVSSRLTGFESSTTPKDVYYQRTTDASFVLEWSYKAMLEAANEGAWRTAAGSLSSDYSQELAMLHMFSREDTWPSATAKDAPRLPKAATQPQVPTVPDPTASVGPQIGGGGAENVAGGAGLNINDYRP